jgi:transcriptional regulator with XRE-family HTH domain
MSYREDLQRRLQGAPFSLAAIARAAGVSREWVSKARSGQAHKITPETAARIQQAIDQLVAQALRGERQHHPGIEALAANRHLRARHHVTEREIEQLREIRTTRPIQTEMAALMMVMALRMEPPH